MKLSDACVEKSISCFASVNLISVVVLRLSYSFTLDPHLGAKVLVGLLREASEKYDVVLSIAAYGEEVRVTAANSGETRVVGALPAVSSETKWVKALGLHYCDLYPFM